MMAVRDEEEKLTSCGILKVLGLVRDGIHAARPAVEMGFVVAERSVDFAFFAAHAGVTTATATTGSTTTTSSSNGTGAVTPVHSILHAAHTVSRNSLKLSADVTKLSLRVSDFAVGLTGAERGETLRVLQAHVVDAQVGTDRQEVKAALLGLSIMLVDLGGRLVPDPLLLWRGARQLALVHQQRRKDRIARRRERCIDRGDETPAPTVPNGPELDQLCHFMRFSAAAYGHRAWRFLGGNLETGSEQADPSRVTSDRHLIMALTGVENADILRLVQDGDLYRPGHFVAIDRKHCQVIVAIRGTVSFKNVLVDLVCESDDLVSVSDGDEMVGGRAHRGFLRSAQRLAGELHELVSTALDENDGYELVITGHSLGAGIATLLALLWARIPAFRSKNIRAFAFAAPCCVCEAISQAPFTRRHVTSIITGDDVVSRLGLATFKELQRDIVALAPLNDASVHHMAQVLSRLPPEEGKLFCGGRVWWINSAEYEPHPIVEIDPVEELQSMELFANIFAVHFPNSYLKTLRDLDEGSL